MNKQSEEDYLDGLLNSVNKEEKQREMVSVDREFLKELQMAKTGQESWKYGANRFRLELENAAKGEKEFLREFEKELEEDELEDVFKDFDDDMEDFSLEELVNKLRSPDGFGLDKSGTYQETEKTSVNEPDTQDIEDEEPDLSLDLGLNFGFDSPIESDLPNEEAIDLADLGEEDLISLLAGTEDLADIGALLSQNDNEQLVESEDAFAAFASSEMSAQSETVESKDGGNKKKNAPKGGLLNKLTTLLFGKDTAEEEASEKVSLSANNELGVEFLSDENAQILAAFADVDELEATGKNGSKGKKEKKKEAKAKKPAKPKAPKPQKVKKPKEKDNTPPLPKGPVVLVCVLAVSIFVLVYFGTELLGYQSAVSEAKDFFRDGMYTEAANSMSGLKVKKGDALLQNKINTLAAIDGELSSYKVFIKHDKKAEAIDALICAAGRCEVNSERAELFTCTDELSELKAEVTANLKEQFGMSYEEAIELYELTEDSRTEYTIALNKVIEELGMK